MIYVLKGILAIPLNLILFYLFGALILHRKNKPVREGLTFIVGFFAYYTLFFIVCFPFMIKYRPLSWLTMTWVPIVSAVSILSIIINRRNISASCGKILEMIRAHKAVTCVIAVIILIQIVIVTTTYNFTLDAAYYVSNVTTSLETNMINVYDPFTGAWQDHYEVRYLFATYSINDAVMCSILGIPALIQTKLTMSAVVIILVNILYVMIAKCLFRDDAKGVAIMLAMMFLVNMMFYTIFTSSLFLLTRTYEGKTIVGNLSIVAIFYIFMLMISEDEIAFPWLSMFIISLGSMTISSSGNMLIPAQLSILAVPYMFMKKTIRPLPKYIACVLPGVAMVLIYILYVKGVFVFYTYPT